jgi:hypothetical protein
MDVFEEVFDRMDKWRNIPKYSLETRADIFFGIYIPSAFEVKYKIKMNKEVIPEFPLRKATIDPSIEKDQSSFNVDFLAFSEDNKTAFLIELKTDMASRRADQDYYLKAVKNIGLAELIHGLVKIFKATNVKRKYFHLFKMLEDAGVIEIPNELESLVFSKNMRGVNALVNDVKIVAPVGELKVVYLQPTGEGENIINFEEFAGLIEGFGNPVTLRFVESLRRWKRAKAGELDSS